MNTLQVSRRGFLIGLTATGVLAALPVPRDAALAFSLEEAVLTKRPVNGRMILRLVGPIVKAERPVAGYLPLELTAIEDIRTSADEIDVSNLEETAGEFTLGLADAGTFTASGLIAPEIIGKCESGEVLKAAIQIPAPKGAEPVYFSFQCLITQLHAA